MLGKSGTKRFSEGVCDQVASVVVSDVMLVVQINLSTL